MPTTRVHDVQVRGNAEIEGRLRLRSACGRAQLVNGTVTVPTPDIGANSVVILTPQGAATAAGLGVPTRVAGVSFTIASNSGTDNRAVGWLIVQP